MKGGNTKTTPCGGKLLSVTAPNFKSVNAQITDHDLLEPVCSQKSSSCHYSSQKVNQSQFHSRASSTLPSPPSASPGLPLPSLRNENPSSESSFTSNYGGSRTGGAMWNVVFDGLLLVLIAAGKNHRPRARSRPGLELCMAGCLAVSYLLAVAPPSQAATPTISSSSGKIFTAGKTLGVGVVFKSPHIHRTVIVTINMTEGFEALDPDGRWAKKLQQHLCRLVPEYSCAGTSTTGQVALGGGLLSRIARNAYAIGGAVVGAIGLGVYAIAKFVGLRQDVEALKQETLELARTVNGTQAEVVHLQRELLMSTTVAGIAGDYGGISRDRRLPVGFWTEETEEKIVEAAEVESSDCYRLDRVLETFAHVLLIPGKQEWPLLKMEIRLPEFESCGVLSRDLQDIGFVTPKGYAHVRLPKRALVANNTIVGVRDCNEKALNTYHCMFTDPQQKIHPNHTCAAASGEPTMKSCDWELMPNGESCWSHVAADTDHGLYVISTNCKNFSVETGEGVVKAVPLKKAIQATIRLRPNETLLFNGHRYPHMTEITGSMSRSSELKLWDGDRRANELVDELNRWFDQYDTGDGGVGGWGIPTWMWIGGGSLGGLLLVVLSILLVYCLCCKRSAAGGEGGQVNNTIVFNNIPADGKQPLLPDQPTAETSFTISGVPPAMPPGTTQGPQDPPAVPPGATQGPQAPPRLPTQKQHIPPVTRYEERLLLLSHDEHTVRAISH